MEKLNKRKRDKKGKLKWKKENKKTMRKEGMANQMWANDGVAT